MIDQGSVYRQWVLATLVNTTLLSFGLQCGWISVSARILQSDQSPTGSVLSDSDISWLASAPSFSATVAVSVFTNFVDKYGRKKCIVLVAVLQAITWIIKLCPSNRTSLIIARISSGIAAGGCFSVVPMYVKEISEDDMRGTLGMILMIAQNIGILIMFAIGAYLPYNTVLWIVVGIPFLTMIGMIKAPESPSYLVKTGRSAEAANIIAFLRGRSTNDKLVQSEVDLLESEVERFKSLPNISYAQIFKHKAWGRGFTIMILMMICHGMNGGFSIISYASIILAQAGVTISPELQSLAIPVFMIIGSLISMICVERLGRKIMICASFMISCIVFCAFAGMLLSQGSISLPGWLPTLALILAVCAYAAGVSPMPFVIMSEMFNLQIRAKVMGVLVTLGWLFASVQVLLYNPIANAFGVHMPFICFAVVNLFGAAVSLLFLPETKGKSAEQIEIELEKRMDNI